MRSLLGDLSVRCYVSVIRLAVADNAVQVLNYNIKDLSRSVVSLAIQTISYLRKQICHGVFLNNFRRVMVDFRFTLAERTELKALLKANRLSRMTWAFLHILPQNKRSHWLLCQYKVHSTLKKKTAVEEAIKHCCEVYIIFLTPVTAQVVLNGISVYLSSW